MSSEETIQTTPVPVKSAEPASNAFSLASAKTALGKQAYHEVIGRRKTSIARVRVQLDKKVSFKINDRELENYFPATLYRTQVTAPVSKVHADGISFTAVVHGGGTSSQAEAIRHGIARALVFLDPETRTALKRAGYLKRDPRSKERKKPGLKKARKAAQWSKR